MAFLFLDTCTERSLLFFYDGKVCHEKHFPMGLKSANILFVALEEGIESTGITLSSLDFIAVGIGPGSYTGIRSGVMAAKSISYATSLPIVGFSTLCCFEPSTEGPFAIVIDAKISGIYYIMGLKAKGTITYTTQPKLVTPQQFANRLSGEVTIVTPVIESVKSKISCSNEGIRWEESAPSSRHIAKLAQEQYRAGAVYSHRDLPILYLRKTQAEIEQEERTCSKKLFDT